MPSRPENAGTCGYCGEVITKRGVTKHLEKCPMRIEALQTATDSQRPMETIWHLRVQDADNKDFWLDLEMNLTFPVIRAASDQQSVLLYRPTRAGWCNPAECIFRQPGRGSIPSRAGR